MANSQDPRPSPLLAAVQSHRPSGSFLAIACRLPTSVRVLLLVVAVLPGLLLVDHMCLLATRLPVSVEIRSSRVVVNADSSSLATDVSAVPDAVLFVSASPTIREYQVDGTDSTNNFTEDAADLAALVPSPAYQLEAWMRDNAAYGSWVDLTIRTAQGQGQQIAVPAPNLPVTLPRGEHVDIDAKLERPEAPAAIEILSEGHTVATLTLDRNNRVLELTGASAQPESAYFPMQPLPFLAEVMDSLLRVAIWAWVVLALMLALSGVLVAARHLAHGWGVDSEMYSALSRWGQLRARQNIISIHAILGGISPNVQRAKWARVIRRASWADRLALGMLGVAFGFALFVTLAQYHGEPHILDASAYYFQAKIFASGRLSAPVPADLPAFQGPFMVAWQGRWFAQYPPATSALLALGMVLRVPWLIEPLLGVAALGGIFLLGRRLFGGPTALLAVALGALSPFFIYLAAAYLSHTVALCFGVFFLLFIVRFCDTYRQRDIMAAGACLGVMFCARELSAVIYGVAVSAWLLAWHGRRWWRDRAIVVPSVLAGLSALGVGLALYLVYNFTQTGDPLVLPRNLFSPADRYGFGVGIGFYGRHTLAAGLVILDQLLTSLMIDLFGWPFYLTLAFIPLALLRRDDARRWDWFNLTLASLLFVAQAGYFYHGIYLGPRYLYDTLPFLLLLTARGITALPVLAHRITGHAMVVMRQAWGEVADNGSAYRAVSGAQRTVGVGACIVVLALVGFNVTFYLPQQFAQHWNFTGLPSDIPFNVAAIYHNPPHHALVVTGNRMVYNYILWPLNDPMLHGDALYAFAPEAADVTRLKQEFPDRRFYALELGADGAVSYVPLSP